MSTTPLALSIGTVLGNLGSPSSAARGRGGSPSLVNSSLHWPVDLALRGAGNVLESSSQCLQGSIRIVFLVY